MNKKEQIKIYIKAIKHFRQLLEKERDQEKKKVYLYIIQNFYEELEYLNLYYKERN